MSYPYTRVYPIISSNTVSATTDSITMKLAAISKFKPVDWHVTIVLKRSKRRNTLSDGSDYTDKTKNSGSSLYFVRIPDCGRCCVVPRSKDENTSPITSSDILVGEENIEEIISTSAELVVRSTWRVIGWRYRVEDYIIGIGNQEHGADKPIPVLEISSIHSGDHSTLSLLIHKIACDLIALPGESVSPETLKTFCDMELEEAGSHFTISHRALQWVQILTTTVEMK
mmetsp:Transcript_11506/g.11525  ORF Transcript_11506/g.11525 Transcript_11506/m.11525 type:complete len:227 (+) Transcript_11506:331-1011(+)